MKTPRVSDFDPNAKARELKSSMDNFPIIEKPPQQKDKYPTHKHEMGSQDILQNQSELHITERPNERTTERPNSKRIITRNSFEIYEDQMESLRELSYREKRGGKLGSMSAMVREAIDSFLNKKSSV